MIDYALARRAVLADLAAGRVSRAEVCDAHPYLLRAARYHGEPSDTPCPVCRRSGLSYVTYAYGAELGEGSGRARGTHELAGLDDVNGEVQVYVVEVCRDCGWNHLVTRYQVGEARKTSRRPAGSGRRR